MVVTTDTDIYVCYGEVWRGRGMEALAPSLLLMCSLVSFDNPSRDA